MKEKGKKNRWDILRALFAFSLVATLAGCGGGGGDTTGGGGGGNSINGIAFKGPIKDGTVKVYVLKTDGTKGDLLDSTTTKEDGSYSANIGSYTGNVIVEVEGGTYTDEATNTTE